MRLMFIATVMLLCGCASKATLPVEPVIKYEAPETDSVSVYVPHFYVITKDTVDKILSEKKVLIGLTYDDSIELRKSLEDVNTYILTQKEALKVNK